MCFWTRKPRTEFNFLAGVWRLVPARQSLENPQNNCYYHCTEENIKYAESLMKWRRPSVRSIQIRYFVIVRIGICEFIFTGKSAEIGMQIWKLLTSERNERPELWLSIISNQLNKYTQTKHKGGTFQQKINVVNVIRILVIPGLFQLCDFVLANCDALFTKTWLTCPAFHY